MKALVKVQLQGLLASLLFTRGKGGDGKQRRSTGAVIGMSLLLIFCFLVFMGMFLSTFFALGLALAGTDNAWLYFAMMGILVFLTDFITTIFTAKSQLFEADDNEMLLSLPLSPRDILLSRMVIILLSNYLFTLMIAIPAFIAWALISGFTPLTGFLFVVSVVFLPYLALSLSCLVGWLLSLLTSRMKNTSLFTTVFSLGFFAIYMVFVSEIETVLDAFMNNLDEVASTVSYIFFPFRCMGNGILGDPLALLLFILCMVVPFLITLWILSRTFLSIATRKRGASYRAYRTGTYKSDSPMGALLKREFRHLASSSVYMMNAGIGLIFLVLLAGAFPVMASNSTILTDMGDSASSIFDMLSGAGILAVCFAASGVTFTSASVSLEGDTLWLIKTLPIDPYKLLLSKLAMQWILVCPLSFLASLMACIFLPMSIPMMLLTLIIPQIFNIFMAELGLRINLAFPRFDWTHEAIVVKQSLPILFSMLGGTLASLITGMGGIALSTILPDFVAYSLAALPILVISLYFTWDLKVHARQLVDKLA